jgi:alpha-ketoglutaric semialdehyde dehydrogenase
MAKTFTAFNPETGNSVGAQILEWDQPQVLAAIKSAEQVKSVIANQSPNERALLLENIAKEIETDKEKIAAIANQETALPLARLTGEVMRTVVQLKNFANFVRTGEHFNAIIDLADPNYLPVARPDLRKTHIPLGVVAVFAASNFPLAFSVAGGDTASALAAGCPVIVKAHPSHPNTCELVFQAVQRALSISGLPKQLFSIVQGVNPQITHWLASAEEITAIGFTGSPMVGKLLVDIAAKRKNPIPVFAEMGSLNPVFFTELSLKDKSAELAKLAMESALLGSGQFCTKPGILIVPIGESGDAFVKDVSAITSAAKVAPLLNSGIATRYTDAITKLSGSNGLQVFAGVKNESGYSVAPTVFVVNWSQISKHDQLLEEHFGPTTVIIRAAQQDFLEIARFLGGQLTASIHATSDEINLISPTNQVSKLISEISQIAGRVIFNGFPTSVSVTAAMQHGGQWPASSTHTTSVGLDAIYRFLRPVVYQAFPDRALPAQLQNLNPYKISRKVNGVRSDAPLT